MANNRPGVGAPRRPGTPSTSRARLVATNLVKVPILLGVVIGSGALAGAAIGYPLKSVDLGGKAPIALDQEALAGASDPALAMLTLDDLPKGFVTDPNANGDTIHLIGSTYCDTVTPDDPVGSHLARAFVHPGNGWIVLAEVQRVRRAQDAGKYIRELTASLDKCDGFYRVDNGVRAGFSIVDDRPDPPVLDYVSRTLSPVDGGVVQIGTYYQVGNLIIALQYSGPANPPRSLMTNSELEVLYRIAPDQVFKTEKVDGKKPLPGTAISTTTAVGAASPTSSPPPPPTVAIPEPTFEPTTTIRRKTSTTTKKKSTTATTVPQKTATTASGQ